jgi:hypothetical protein
MSKAVWEKIGSIIDVSTPSSPKKKLFEVSPSDGFVEANTVLKSMFISNANPAPWCDSIARLMVAE